MTKFSRSSDGKYLVKGKSYEMLIGTRAQVWHKTAYKTTGGLTHAHLMQNKSGRIVSKSKHMTAKKEKRLLEAGYGTKKGTFGFVKIAATRRSRKNKRGGAQIHTPIPRIHQPPLISTRGGGAQIHIPIPRIHQPPLISTRGGGAAQMNTAASGSTTQMSASPANMMPSSHSPATHSAAASMQKNGGRRHRKGGMHALSPSAYDGKGVGTSGVDLQFIAGNAA